MRFLHALKGQIATIYEIFPIFYAFNLMQLTMQLKNLVFEKYFYIIGSGLCTLSKIFGLFNSSRCTIRQ